MQDLQPTNLTIYLVDHLINYLVGLLKYVPIQVGKFIIPCGFVVFCMDKSFQGPIILRRLFIATIGAVIDVPTRKLSFRLCGETAELCSSSPIALSAPTGPLVCATHMVPITLQIFLRLSY